MNRRTFAALFCILFAVPFFSGCGVDENSEILISESVETTKRTQITEITKITNVTGTQTNTTTAPFKEKNIFDAIQRLCFHGKQFSFGCLYGAISDTFTLENPFYSKEAGYTLYALCFNGQKVASIGIEGTPAEQNDNKEIVSLIVEDEQLADLTIDGENAVVGMETMQKIFKPDKIHEPNEYGIGGLEYLSDTIDITMLFQDDLTNDLTIIKNGLGE